jgi:hypothetical protein
MSTIETLKIHPAIGIARLGNSPTGFFIGPELPGVNKPPTGGYKDAKMRIKRQAARFRIFGYDENGDLVKEITAEDAEIKWTVHLVNKKAAWKEFDGLDPNRPLRNRAEKNRNNLIIDPGERTLDKINSSALFDTGTFYGKPVPLGEMRVDKNGRLTVLGGFGSSSSIKNKPPKQFANNDGWHDDVSDGPVTASVKLKGEKGFKAALPAWVICGPPDFAPALGNVIRLYDTLIQVAIDRLNYRLPEIPSFTNDIFPILSRANNMKWVTGMMWVKEGDEDKEPEAKEGGKPAAKEDDKPAPGDDSDEPKVGESHHKDMEESAPLIIDTELRQKIFGMLTDPSNPLAGEDNDMPMLWSDYYKDGKRDNGKPRNLTLCQWQYDYLDKWARGFFNDDWAGVSAPSTTITPEGLDRAALENCIGGAFYPGIEASWLVRDYYDFIEPFRLSHALLSAGDVTKQMALPWQADFNDCQAEDELAWWPAQRPDDVFPAPGAEQVPWTRDFVNNMAEMVDNWHKLGFVTLQGADYIETERNP